MKKEDLSNNLGTWLDFSDALPSARRKLCSILYYDYHMNTVYDLCSKSEDEIRTYDDMDDELITILKDMLAVNGLKLGMTAEELANYEDNEYYMSHPDKRPEGFVPMFEKSIDEYDKLAQEDFNHELQRQATEHEDYIPVYHFEPEEPKEEKPKVVLTDSLKQKLLYIEEKRRTLKYTEKLNDRGNMKLYPEDIEFMYIHVLRIFLMVQPWYVRLFKKMDERIEMAKEATEDWIESYKKGVVKAQVKNSLELFSQELDNCWDVNWQNYIKELER